MLPGDPAGRVLSTSDTIAWRNALQKFWDTRIGSNPQAQEDLPRLRAEAEEQLLHLESAAKTPGSARPRRTCSACSSSRRRWPGTTRTSSTQTLRQTIDYFQQAIALDPTNAAAKQNLELVLRVTRPGKGPIGKDAHAGFGFGRGHGSTQLGNGY